MKRILGIATAVLISAAGWSTELGGGHGSDYPATLDVDAFVESATTYARQAVPNDSNSAIIKIENELGTDPSGTTYSTVKDRIKYGVVQSTGMNDGTLTPTAGYFPIPGVLVASLTVTSANRTQTPIAYGVTYDAGGAYLNYYQSAYPAYLDYAYMKAYSGKARGNLALETALPQDSIMLQYPGGNVGIGMLFPGAPLQVAGNITCSSFTVNGASLFGGQMNANSYALYKTSGVYNTGGIRSYEQSASSAGYFKRGIVIGDGFQSFGNTSVLISSTCEQTIIPYNGQAYMIYHNLKPYWNDPHTDTGGVCVARASRRTGDQWTVVANPALASTSAHYTDVCYNPTDGKYYMAGTRDSDGHVYLYSSTNLVAWSVENSSNPILTKGGQLTNIFNPTLAIDGTNKYYLGVEYSSTTADDFKVALTYAQSPTWSQFQSNINPYVPIIQPTSKYRRYGNPDLKWSYRDQALRLITGAVAMNTVTTYDWRVAAYYCTNMAAVTDPASWSRVPTWEIYTSSVQVSDPSLDETDGTLDAQIELTNCYAQRDTVGAVSNATLDDFFDALISTVVADRVTGTAGIDGVRNINQHGQQDVQFGGRVLNNLGNPFITSADVPSVVVTSCTQGNSSLSVTDAGSGTLTLNSDGGTYFEVNNDATWQFDMVRSGNKATWAHVYNGTDGSAALAGQTCYTVTGGYAQYGNNAQSFTSSGMNLPLSSFIRSYGATNGLAVYTTDAYPVRFGTNETERMRIAAGGKVGVGLTIPGDAFQVAGGITASSLTVNGVLGTTGNMGIGTLSPADRLHVDTADTDSNLRVRGGLGAYGAGYSGVGLQSLNDAANARKMLILDGAPIIFPPDGGNVGVGVIAPGDKLQVAGGITCTTMTVNGAAQATDLKLTGTIFSSGTTHIALELSADATISASSSGYVIPFDSHTFINSDPLSEWNLTTHEFYPKINGWYKISCDLDCTGLQSTQVYDLAVNVRGGANWYTTNRWTADAAANDPIHIEATVWMNTGEALYVGMTSGAAATGTILSANQWSMLYIDRIP